MTLLEMMMFVHGAYEHGRQAWQKDQQPGAADMIAAGAQLVAGLRRHAHDQGVDEFLASLPEDVRLVAQEARKQIGRSK